MDTVHQLGLASQLLVGSRNIDKMRKDIDDLVKMTMGYIKACDKDKLPNAPNDFTAVFDGGQGMWVVRYTNHAPGAGFRRYVSIEYEQGKDITFTSRDGRGANGVKTEHVQGVYEGLAHLVQWLANRAPHIEQLWEPLLRASKVSF